MDENESLETSHLFSECENGQRPEPPSSKAKRSGMDYGLFVTLMLGAFLAYADDTFVFTTHVTIASQLGTGTMGSWLVTAYNLGFAVSLPLYGRICDIYGYKYPIQGAYLLFSIGCAMSGFSSSLWTAIIGRLLSGAGGSGMTDLVIVIINDMVPPRAATALRSYVSIVMTIGVSVGAPLGGALTHDDFLATQNSKNRTKVRN
ncbi:major facilitator superfamily domain-containing protein [Penicillium frequentans]|nr:major facilitator superfamily domain-containing protein [Penicillium glabrum]